MLPGTLKTEFMPYDEGHLKQWRTGDYSLLAQSNVSAFIKKIITTKSKKRPGRRFFGEAFIAINTDMADGYYNSYKWLTSEKWLNGKGLKTGFEQKFFKALLEHFGKDTIANLQQKSLALYQKQKKRLEGKPVAPDLWIIGKNNHHRFIESKLPGDQINERQIAGLALIHKYLGKKAAITVSITCLYPKGTRKPEEKDYSDAFSFYDQMA